MRWRSSTMTDYLADDTLYVLSPDLLQAGGQQTVNALKTWSLLQAEKFREYVTKQRCLAEARQAQTEKDRQDQAAQLAAVRSEQKAIPRPYWGRAILLLLCAFVGLAAEWVLTLTTIPFIFDLKRSSILASLLSFIPVVATLGLDGIFDRLLEQPWLRARIAASRGQGPCDGGKAERRMTWFLIGLGLLIVGMFLALGLARMEAVHWQTLLTTADSSTELTSLVSLDLALIVFSIGVLVVTAWLLLLGLNHARLCARHMGLARRLHRQTQRFLAAREAATQAAGEAARWRMKDAQNNRLTELTAQWLFAYQILQTKTRHTTHPDLAQRVDRALAQLGLAVRPGSSQLEKEIER